MADLIGETALTRTARGVRVESVAMLRGFFGSSKSMLRAGEMNLISGECHIYLIRGGDPNNADHLFSVSQNKAIDAFLFTALDPQTREAIFVIHEGVAALQGQELLENQELRYAQVALVFITYILHGSLGNFARTPAKPAKFGVETLALEPAQMTSDALCTFPTWTKMKIPAVAELIPSIAAQFHDTVQSRAMLSTGGNRVFAILKRVGDKVAGADGVPEQLAALANQYVLDNAPYASYHPDHHANPMKNHSKAMMAAVGHFGTKGGVNWDEEAKESPGLYIAPVLKALKVKFMEREHKLPTMDSLLRSLDAAYSIPHAVRLNA